MLTSRLKPVAKRIVHGIARTGTISHNSSGEIFLSLSTAGPQADAKGNFETWKVLPKEKLDPVFKATVEATEEAIINTLVAAEDMEGINGNKIYAISHERLKKLMQKE